MRSLSPFAAAFACLSTLTLAAEPVVPERGTMVFQHVTVIDVLNGSPLTDRSVAVAGGKIIAVGPAASVETPAGAKVVDSTGKYLIPGLWDMHVHFVFRNYGPLFVADGVTGVARDVGQPAGVAA